VHGLSSPNYSSVGLRAHGLIFTLLRIYEGLHSPSLEAHHYFSPDGSSACGHLSHQLRHMATSHSFTHSCAWLEEESLHEICALIVNISRTSSLFQGGSSSSTTYFIGFSSLSLYSSFYFLCARNITIPVFVFVSMAHSTSW
jgi:hypothetical protein